MATPTAKNITLIKGAIAGANWDIAHSPGRIKQELYIGRREAFQAVRSLLNGDSVPIRRMTANRGAGEEAWSAEQLEDATDGDAE